MKYKIYKRVLNDEIVYIGSTSLSLKQRKTKGYGKLSKILKNASIVLIEETDDKHREDFWIDYYRSMGCELFNTNKAVADKDYYRKYREDNKEYLLKYRREYYREYRKRKKLNKK